MKIIYNSIIPFNGFKAINIFGFLFVRNGCTISEDDLNHESIHTTQMKEMLYVFFYIWYLFEWVIRLFKKGNAYKNISFEREAYLHEKNHNYLNTRKSFSWLEYI